MNCNNMTLLVDFGTNNILIKSNGLSIWPQAPIEIITAKCEGIRDVGSARYELALLPPMPDLSLVEINIREKCDRDEGRSEK